MTASSSTVATKHLLDRVLTALYTRPSPLKVALAVTGGGAAAAPLLFRAGSSSTMLQFSVPYARASLQQFISASDSTFMPKFVSQEMAEQMAVSAWCQAQQILWEQEKEESAATASSVDATLDRFRATVGVGCTASLASNYDRRGVNQAFISICRVAGPNVERRLCETFHVRLDKSLQRAREEEDQLVSQFVVYLLAKSAHVDPEGCALLLEDLKQRLGGPDDQFMQLQLSADGVEAFDALATLSNGRLTSVAFLPDVGGALNSPSIVQDMPFKGLLLSGSFNPLHQGHVDLALAAQRLLKTKYGKELPIAFEIAVANADKGSIATATVTERVEQFVDGGAIKQAKFGKWPVLVTNATLFTHKAHLQRDCVFIIGADTAVRLVDKKYYEMDEHKMVLALRQVADLGCSFVVAGRFDEKGTKRFISAEEVCANHVPSVLKDMFFILREEDFRNDLSSTQLRQSSTVTADA